MTDRDLDHLFQTLTATAAAPGFAPMSWQKRFYQQWLSQGRIPASVDVPTGLGKTSVMALWLLALATGVRLPRRLVYVVDRRAVVDQATAFAETIRTNLAGLPEVRGALGLAEQELPISTLRGQFADNRAWLEDPSVPCIVVGTVDMVGSRLLFGGYGVSRKMRSYHAGLLGVDALLVLDEAHLVPPFEAMLRSLEQGVDGLASVSAPAPGFRPGPRPRFAPSDTPRP